MFTISVLQDEKVLFHENKIKKEKKNEHLQ
jgi:hypothetical protein